MYNLTGYTVFSKVKNNIKLLKNLIYFFKTSSNMKQIEY